MRAYQACGYWTLNTLSWDTHLELPYTDIFLTSPWEKILVCGWFTDSRCPFSIAMSDSRKVDVPKKGTVIQIPSRQNLGYVPWMRHRKQLVYISSSLSNPQRTFLPKKCWNMFHQSQEHAPNVPNVYLDPLKRTSRGGVENSSQAQWDAMSPSDDLWGMMT